jgi:GT2 family glycosyltransferase
MPSIDVVVATYNRPDRLRRCLAGLAGQDTDSFGVIVADDCSERPVSEWLDPEAYPFPLRVTRTTVNSGPAGARNLAVSLSEAEYIAFIDDDVVPERRLLGLHLDAARRGGAHTAVIGPLLLPPNWNPTPWIRWEAATIAIEYRRMISGHYAPTWRQFFTGNAVVGRSDFISAGGFNEAFRRAEDIELAYRLEKLGCTFVFEPRAIGWHFAERSLQSWRAIPQQYARFDQEIDRAHPELGWSRRIEHELGRRNVATRGLTSTMNKIRSEKMAASAAIGLSRSLDKIGLRSLTTPLLSLAFHLEYQGARRTVGDIAHEDRYPITTVQGRTP